MEFFLIVVVAFIAMALAFLGMATGVLRGKSPLKGSCGGLKTLGLACSCSEPCERKKRAMGLLPDSPVSPTKP